MNMLFQNYFIKFSPYKRLCTTSWIYYNIYDFYNISPFLLRHNVYGHQKANLEVHYV